MLLARAPVHYCSYTCNGWAKKRRVGQLELSGQNAGQQASWHQSLDLNSKLNLRRKGKSIFFMLYSILYIRVETKNCVSAVWRQFSRTCANIRTFFAQYIYYFVNFHMNLWILVFLPNLKNGFFVWTPEYFHTFYPIRFNLIRCRLIFFSLG
jgi:hypothetical protein